MSDSNSNTPKASSSEDGVELYRPYSAQPTSLVETSFAGSLGLSMHNEVSGQQSARLTTLASTTNACKLMLQSKVRVQKPPKKEEEVAEVQEENTDLPKKKFNLKNFLKRDKKEPSVEVSDDNSTTE